jgi:hypothetical protein
MVVRGCVADYPQIKAKVFMPLTKIAAPTHIPSSKLKALADGVQEGLVTTCKVPPEDLFQLITHLEPNDIILDPHFGGVTRSSEACVIEIVFLIGRTDDQKRALFRHVVEKAVQAGFRSDDIMIALIENTRMDWSLGHGVAYADHHVKL